MGYSWLITACYDSFSSRHAGASIGLPAQYILVTVRLSGVVTMGYSWLITARCGYPCYQHAESSMGREAVGGVYTNNPFLGCLLFCSALNVAW